MLKVIQGDRPDDGGSKHLCNVSQLLHGTAFQETAIFKGKVFLKCYLPEI
jgi:hypothetical protein